MEALIIEIAIGLLAFCGGVIVLFFQSRFKNYDRQIEKLFQSSREAKNIEIRLAKIETTLQFIGSGIFNGSWDKIKTGQNLKK